LTAVHVAALHAHEPDALLFLFGQLLAQLSGQLTLFVLLDGLTAYETTADEPAMLHLLRGLVAVAAEQHARNVAGQTAVNLKLLLTNPGMGGDGIRAVVPEGKRLSLPDEVLGDGMMFTERHMVL
jgi:hypothetical protein